MRRSILTTAAVLAIAAATPARADEITDAIGEAQRAYQGGQMQAAQTALQEALQLLQQRGAATLAAALPDALPGWTADEATSNAAGGAGMFGGSTASRTYRNAQGQSVEIEVMSDNPMIAQIGAMLANPMMAGAMGRLVRIGEQRAIQATDGNVSMLVDNRILVQVQGDAPPDAKLAYARAINAARLAGR
jgi:opacity protein-like surface antigen